MLSVLYNNYSLLNNWKNVLAGEYFGAIQRFSLIEVYFKTWKKWLFKKEIKKSLKNDNCVSWVEIKYSWKINRLVLLSKTTIAKL